MDENTSGYATPSSLSDEAPVPGEQGITRREFLRRPALITVGAAASGLLTAVGCDDTVAATPPTPFRFWRIGVDKVELR